MAGNIGSTAIMLFIVVLFLAGISFVADDFQNNNMMDTASQELLIDLSSEYADNYDTKELYETPEDAVTNTSVFSGVDDFARQYLENKAEIASTKSTMTKFIELPQLMLKIFGIENAALLTAWSTAIYGLLTFLIALYAYKAIKTGEVDG